MVTHEKSFISELLLRETLCGDFGRGGGSGASLSSPLGRKFNFDLSCNASLVLGKSNNLNPQSLAKQLKNLFENEIKESNFP